MALDGKILAEARKNIADTHERNMEETQRRRDRIYLRIPEVRCIDERLRAQMVELFGLAISKSEDAQKMIDALREENLSLQARRAELLVGNGFPPNWLTDIYSCTKCRDTGILNGENCECLTVEYNRILTRELGTLMKNGDERFELFSLDYYGSERERMEIVLDTCREYAANFARTAMDLLFQGGTGLGKTYLSACIARVVAANGFSVCYDTASSALDAFETKKFARDIEQQEAAAEKVSRMLDCDLMILDDLGTEMVTPMSLSALYTLVNTRLVNGKRTIISTNLSDSELERRYTPQIYSRIAGEFTKLSFAGRDIRKLKKEV